MSLEASAHRVELPALSKETIAGGLLVNGRKVIGLTKTERYHLRVAIEELVANGHNLNDILHVCETTREFYFCQIDTIRELPPGNKNQP
ncbi:MAG: hypothetical protein WC840_05625, partial [Candidatus Peribacteraceae bacterium]